MLSCYLLCNTSTTLNNLKLKDGYVKIMGKVLRREYAGLLHFPRDLDSIR
jgi:hypothetical protein